MRSWGKALPAINAGCQPLVLCLPGRVPGYSAARMVVSSLSIPAPDDWHLHLRDDALLKAVAPLSARHFRRALIMPNLAEPVVTAAQARAYHRRIRAALPADTGFEPLMTLYLTEDTRPDDVAAAHAQGLITAVKLYPAGATTLSQRGVQDIRAIAHILERMQRADLPLAIHGEVTSAEIDIFDREAVFIERVLDPLRRRFPALRIVLEHVTTCQAIAYIREAPPGLAATITAHHLAIDRSDLFAGGIRPHYYCLPLPKRAQHRAALRQAATSGDPRFFFGSDSAPHPAHDKEAACGCAGCFTAPVALALLAQIFDEEESLDRLGAFCGHFGADFYRVPRNSGQVTLTKGVADPHPGCISVDDQRIVVFAPPFPLGWRASAINDEQVAA